MAFDYYYGKQADQFSFFRIPKVLFTDKSFSTISTDAKLLYGILLDRMGLSIKNGWFDNEGRVYIIFTVEEVEESLGCGHGKAVKLLEELDGNIGLIERKRQGLGKPNLIYIKDFLSDVSTSNFLKYENRTSGSTKIELLEVRKSDANNTDINKTDMSKTDKKNTEENKRESLREGEEGDTDTLSIPYPYPINTLSIGYPPDTDTVTVTEAETVTEKAPKKTVKAKRQSKFVPPALAEVEEYCRQRNSAVDPKVFWEYYEASGWVDGKGQPVRNWKQKFITWDSRESSARDRNKGGLVITGNYDDDPNPDIPF